MAARQFGVVTIAQLLHAGFSHDAVARLVKRGWLHRIHRGVYRVGHTAPSTEATYLAAVFACGEGARLSGAAAAFHFGLERKPAPPEVTTTMDRRVNRVITRRVRSLHQLDVASYRGIPITTVPRTLVDLAAIRSLEDLARLCHVAEIKHGLRAEYVEAVLDRRPNAKGADKLRRIFRGDEHLVLSELEREFLKLLREAGLPLPQTNKRFKEGYVDCRWPERRLTIELDSYRFHHSRHAWDADHRRRRAARKRGDRFRRFAWSDVFEETAPMIAELSELLFGGAVAYG